MKKMIGQFLVDAGYTIVDDYHEKVSNKFTNFMEETGCTMIIDGMYLLGNIDRNRRKFALINPKSFYRFIINNNILVVES